MVVRRDDYGVIIVVNLKKSSFYRYTSEMGRYKRKTEGPSWSREALNEAVEAVRSGRMSGYAAASTFSIPRKTIMDHVTGRRGQKSLSLGRPPVFKYETEKMMLFDVDC
ncbi:jg20387 [Pararge aegeria aegeria]|uniref:Jg20387 protein n=1 Tax=Pararge aegeria aegeria TaxID=348720 RepID=A0A8S4S2R9_9NEOP|nr:jg20387 [Pararge aegeria aegeria]